MYVRTYVHISVTSSTQICAYVCFTLSGSPVLLTVPQGVLMYVCTYAHIRALFTF